MLFKVIFHQAGWRKEHSFTFKEGCSFDLSLSLPVKVTHSFNKILQEKTIELAQAESALNAHLENAIRLAQKIEIHLRACEEMIASDQQLLN